MIELLGLLLNFLEFGRGGGGVEVGEVFRDSCFSFLAIDSVEDTSMTLYFALIYVKYFSHK